jgi:hypothetical protein
MTEEQRAKVDALFKDNRKCSGDLYNDHIWICMVNPESIVDAEELNREYRSVTRSITELEELVESLKAVRTAYDERFAKLQSMPSSPVVKLWREKRCNKVQYYFSVVKRYENGQETSGETKIFSGSMRAAAIQTYKTYVKDHPGIIAEMDIAKGRWER